MKAQAHMVRLPGPCVRSPLCHARTRHISSKHPHVMTIKVYIGAGQHRLGVGEEEARVVVVEREEKEKKMPS